MHKKILKSLILKTFLCILKCILYSFQSGFSIMCVHVECVRQCLFECSISETDEVFQQILLSGSQLDIKCELNLSLSGPHL